MWRAKLPSYLNFAVRTSPVIFLRGTCLEMKSCPLYYIRSLLSLECRIATKTEDQRDSRYDTIKTPYAHPKATLPNCTPSPAMARTWTESSLTRCKSNKNQPNTLTCSQFPVLCHAYLSAHGSSGSPHRHDDHAIIFPQILRLSIIENGKSNMYIDSLHFEKQIEKFNP